MQSKMKNAMIVAIVGDIAGSRFEWHNRKTKESIRGRDTKRDFNRWRFRYYRGNLRRCRWSILRRA